MNKDLSCNGPVGFKIHPEMRELFGYCLSKLSLRLRMDFEDRLKVYSLLAPQAAILLLLKKLGPMTQVEIGEHLNIDKATMVRFLDGLEKLKYVVRKAHKTDRRAKVLEMTKTGASILEKVRAIRLQCEEKFLEPLNKTERDQLKKLISKLTSE